ncbi:MAG: hypothetical protein ABIR54_13345 [Burkholderiaceae bacterium]
MTTSCGSLVLECFQSWYGSQSANNTFALLGAIATTAATIVALVLSGKQTRELRQERSERAVLRMQILLPSILRSVGRIVSLIEKLEFGSESLRLHGTYSNAVSAVIADLGEPIEGFDIETATALLPLGREACLKLTKGLTSFELAQNKRLTLHPYADPASRIEPRDAPGSIREILRLLGDAKTSILAGLKDINAAHS